MPDFLVQGAAADEASILSGVSGLGGTVVRRLSNLEALSNTTLLQVSFAEGVGPADIGAIAGVKIVEGTFFHPFYLLPPFPNLRGLIPKVPFLPNQLAAAALQLLPPPLFKQLPAQQTVSNLLGLEILEAEAFADFNVNEVPLGAPGLALGEVVTPAIFQAAGDLDAILGQIRAPEAQAINQGEGAIVAVIDSGVDPSKVPQDRRLGGFSDVGANPWSDSTGHGSMVAGILNAVAPRATIVSVKPGVSAKGAMSSMGTLAALDYLAGLAAEMATPIIANNSWGIYGAKNLILPCNIFITRTVRTLSEANLVQTVWAAGNNRHIVGDHTFSGYCMNTAKWGVSSGALDRGLQPQFYSSMGAQCYPLNPTVATPTYGVLPWGNSFMDFGDQGAGTSACAPQVSGALAMMMTAYPGRPFQDYRAALRAGASNAALGLPGVPYHPATGAGLLQADAAIRAVPSARAHPSWMAENLIPSSIPALGREP